MMPDCAMFTMKNPKSLNCTLKSNVGVQYSEEGITAFVKDGVRMCLRHVGIRYPDREFGNVLGLPSHYSNQRVVRSTGRGQGTGRWGERG